MLMAVHRDMLSTPLLFRGDVKHTGTLPEKSDALGNMISQLIEGQLNDIHIRYDGEIATVTLLPSRQR
jgi:hypothetical protein